MHRVMAGIRQKVRFAQGPGGTLPGHRPTFQFIDCRSLFCGDQDNITRGTFTRTKFPSEDAEVLGARVGVCSCARAYVCFTD